MGLAYAAIPSDPGEQRVLVMITMTCGLLGCLFALAALSFEHGKGGKGFVLLSLLNGAIGTICAVLVTRVWVVAIFLGICIAVTAGTVWYLRTRKRL